MLADPALYLWFRCAHFPFLLALYPVQSGGGIAKLFNVLLSFQIFSQCMSPCHPFEKEHGDFRVLL